MEKKEQRRQVSNEDRALAGIFQSEDGKVAMEYLKQIFVEPSAFNPDPHIMAYQCGRSDTIGFIEDTIEVVKDSPLIQSV